MKILQLAGVTKKFGNRLILDSLNLAVPTGSSLAITGRSGSGKSTLLNIIGLLETHDAGSITLDGKTLPKPGSKQAMLLRRNTISYLFQSFALLPDKTVQENLLLGMQYSPESKKQKLEKICEMLDKLAIGHLKEQRVKTLSGGEQQRIALARCILKPGKLILADEPTGALDGSTAQAAMAELLTLQQEHQKTLIIVTHSPEVAAMCDSRVRLFEGRLAAQQ
ncbi:ATP-binding cassette domain-containing protein [Leucobacter sp. OH2974_COT-288]|nr:ATP-binding cassette domain-containing protein [Leucobacter sp. OH2974_COT-288]